MAKYARGKKSQAISDRSGLRVPYTQLKTTWDGLRVSPEDWEPKQPQLTPAKNVVDATALFNPRPDNDPENVTFFVGFNYDPFLDPRQRPSIGVHGKSGVGFIGITSTNTAQTGVSGTANVGNESLFITTEINVTGSSGSGEVAIDVAAVQTLAVTVQSVGGANKYFIAGVQQDTLELMESRTYYFDQSASSNSGHPLRFSTTPNGTHGGGSEYTTGVTTSGTPGNAGAYTQIVVANSAPTLYYYCSVHSGMGGQANTPVFASVPVELDEIATGVGGSGDVGTGVIEGLPTATGVGGTASVGNVVSVEAFGWGIGAWGQGGWGDLNGSPHTAGLGGIGAVGAESIQADAIITETGVGGSGAVAIEGIQADRIFDEDGVGGAGAVGSEAVAIDSNITVSGLGGTGGVGDEVPFIDTAWGDGTWGSGVWNANIQPPISGSNGAGGVGSVSASTITTWGQGGYGEGTWN
jgi:hypothetical protein